MPKRKASYHHGNLKPALIRAGIQVLSKEGVYGLSLRKVAQKAGVSHAAPYAHFADKQALIAAISTEGYRRLYEAVSRATQGHDEDPAAQLVAASWAYVRFALDDPDHFRVTLSGVVEREKDHPDLVEMSQKSLALLTSIAERCQSSGVLPPGPSELVAVSTWSLIHGFVSLVLEDQIPTRVLEEHSLAEMLLFSLNRIARLELSSDLLPESAVLA